MGLHTALMIALLLAPDPDAVSCTGTSDTDIRMGGKTAKETTPLPEQIYVIDAGKNELRHALLGKREYENFCTVVAPNCTVTITPTRVRAGGSKPADNGSTVEVQFDLNRTSGVGRFELIMMLPNSQHVKLRWNMQCKPTTAPVF